MRWKIARLALVPRKSTSQEWHLKGRVSFDRFLPIVGLIDAPKREVAILLLRHFGEVPGRDDEDISHRSITSFFRTVTCEAVLLVFHPTVSNHGSLLRDGRR